ncbi:MAG: signal recognition particle-docking protein FtsY [Actinobacteria bacterium]|nr:signal recognition particle-docking protein FtsY [Actinomycetota bacterium]
MESVVIVLIGVALVLALVSGGLLVARRNKSRIPLEPPPDARTIPPEVKEDVARRKAELIERLDEEAHAARREAGLEGVEEKLERKRRRQGEEPELGAAAPSASPAAPVATPEAEPEIVQPVPVKPRFRDRLAKARSRLAGVVGSLRKTKIDDDIWDELEEALIGADVGIEPTAELLDHLRDRVKAEGLTEGGQLVDALKDEMKQRLSGFDLSLDYAASKPSVWLFVGVNGVGKTTTIGKVGKREVEEGKVVVMAAGDTFRAAATEQLEVWAERAGADLVRGNEGGDPSAVIFDAIASASANDADLVLADTAGRLHTKVNLMEELSKVRRVADKGAGTVTEVLLVLDATTGQNGLQQAKQFTDAVDLTGVVLTKLDGSAKGGIIFAIQNQLGIPVKLVGLGESADDLVAFDADEFVDALFE